MAASIGLRLSGGLTSPWSSTTPTISAERKALAGMLTRIGVVNEADRAVLAADGCWVEAERKHAGTPRTRLAVEASPTSRPWEIPLGGDYPLAEFQQ